MANRFILYVPKPTNAKYSSKPLCWSVLKEFNTFDSNQQIEQNPVPIGASTVDCEFLMQKVNGDDRMVEGTLTRYIYRCRILMQAESLMEICKSSNKGNEDEDDIYFPTVQELIAGRGVSKGHVPKAVDKLALDDGDHSVNPKM
jgi:hypothetical protein